MGKTLCTTLMINIVSPHISKLAFPLLNIFYRFKDRSWSNQLFIEETENDQEGNEKTVRKVNTQKFF